MTEKRQAGPFDVAYYHHGTTGPAGAISHTHQETWQADEYFCPACGKQAVWFETGLSDYDLGPQHLCVACGASFYLPMGASARDTDEQDRQRLAAIRGAPRGVR